MKAHEYSFILWPKQWISYRDIHDWQLFKLISEKKKEIPSKPGIYTLLVQPCVANHPASSYLMYVGRTKSLKRRFSEYLNEKNLETGRPKIYRLLNKFTDNIWFCFTEVSEDKLIAIEDGLISAYVPPANDQVPIELRKTVGAFK